MKLLSLMLASALVAQPLMAAVPKAVMVDLNQSTGDVEFLAVGQPSFLKIRGKKGQVQGRMIIRNQTLSAKLKVPLKDFDTGMSLRNEHMRDNYLKVDKFPLAVLSLSKVPLGKNFLADAKAKKQDIPFVGKLQLHGVTREVKGVAQLQRSGDDLKGEAKFSLDITDFGIDIPSFKGITVAKQVTITAKIDAPLKPYQRKK